MVHDPTALEPRCRLQEEDSDEYGAVIVPETAVAEAIRERTEDHLRKIGATVSGKPIVMRAECGPPPMSLSWDVKKADIMLADTAVIRPVRAIAD